MCIRLCMCMLPLALLTSMPLSADERTDFFERKIRPVLVEHCYACHSKTGSDIEGGLRLDSRQAMRRGGESGPAVLPEQVDKSLLISAIKYVTFEMPPDRKLPASVVRDFEIWIEQGAVDPREEEAVPLEDVEESKIDYDQGRQFWAFRRPQRHPLPEHSQRDWCLSDIDHFVAAALDNHQLTPSQSAAWPTLLRRVSMDLTGLPPSQAISQAVEKFPETMPVEAGLQVVVDQLLASSAFGEHWARLWLDVMRYADDQAHIVGDNSSLFFPNSYLYRDWVVSAFNRDLPYRRFIELQLAADLITPEDLDDDVALGFIGLGPKYYRRNAPEVMAEEWEDRVDVVSRGMLGLTVACARCHDHKYDPIGTADYYALAGVFASVDMFNRPLSEAAEVSDSGEAKLPGESLHIVRDREQPQDLSIMVRGDVNRKGPVEPRHFLTVLCSAEPTPFSRDNSGRLDLARSIASTENPLTARVFVNRVWARLIGQPLVGTPSNFGALGERPTHPELLDDLTVRFMENEWSLKWLCREIVLSATYQQSSDSQHTPCADTAARVDQSNRLLWRMNRKRLSVEQWRDNLLVAADHLDGTLGGQSQVPDEPHAHRRTLYSPVSRLKLNPMLALFDFPDPNAHAARRSQTTTPSQKLFLLNSPFMVELSRSLVSQLQSDPSEQAAVQQNAAQPEVARQETVQRETTRQEVPEQVTSDSLEPSRQETLVRRAYQALFSRLPSPEELQVGKGYLSAGEMPKQLETYVHGLMVTNETLFVD